MLLYRLCIKNVKISPGHYTVWFCGCMNYKYCLMHWAEKTLLGSVMDGQRLVFEAAINQS